MKEISAVRRCSGGSAGSAGSAGFCSACCSADCVRSVCCFSSVSPHFAFIFAPRPPDIHSFESDGEKSACVV